MNLTVNTSWPRNIWFFREDIVLLTSETVVPLVEVTLKSVVSCSSITHVHHCLTMSRRSKSIPHKLQFVFGIRSWGFGAMRPFNNLIFAILKVFITYIHTDME